MDEGQSLGTDQKLEIAGLVIKAVFGLFHCCWG